MKTPPKNYWWPWYQNRVEFVMGTEATAWYIVTGNRGGHKLWTRMN